MPVDPFRLQQLFELALDRPAEERAAFLDGECAADVELRARVGALLDGLASAGQEFLAEPGSATGGDDEEPGRIIDRYKLLEPIGEGGFGAVWMAEQLEPVRRKVALKVIKLGMDSRQVVARFEAERQALALMEHPNIARVFDGGLTPGGRPYFVMELVRGVSITEYCDQAGLDGPQRLALFQAVCHAVQHAHQKGVIHRDVKPSNILVTLHDGVPVPKVIDFGIAKATSAELTQKTLFTEFRQMVGTPEYMAPEQAEMSGLDVDSRADIYSLGVVLDELLTGSKPYEARSLLDQGYLEMLRVIREDDPPKPSTRISTLGDRLAAVARRRQTTPTLLGRSLRGDLDWIVMRALEKDRSRRYPTANDLAADIGRHLADEPVQAGPPGTGYRLRKFVRRNSVAVIAGTSMAAALVLGIVGTTYGLIRARASEGRAIGEAARATAIAGFVTAALDSSNPLNPGGSQGMTILDAMKQAVRGLESGRFADFPETEASLLDTIGNILANDGSAAEAEPLLVKALYMRRTLYSDDHPDVETSLHRLALVRRMLGRAAEAEELYERALEMSERLHTGDHETVATNLMGLANVRQELGRAAEAEPMLVDALEMSRRLFPGDHPTVASNLNSLAIVMSKLGRGPEAEPLFTAALEMLERLYPGDDPRVATGLAGVAIMHGSLGRVEQAEPLFRRALEMKRRLYRGDHPQVATSLDGLAWVMSAMHRVAEAEPLHRQALEMNRRLHPGDHPNVALSLNNLAHALNLLGRAAEAEPLAEEGLEMCQRLHPDGHADVADSYVNLALIRRSLGRPEAAEPLLEKSLEMSRRIHEHDHPLVAIGLDTLAEVKQSLGRPEEAEPLFREALEMNERLYRGEDHPQVSSCLNNLVGSLVSRGRLSDAEPLARRALEMNRRLHSADHPDVARSLSNLATLLHGLGNDAEAEALLEESVEMRRRLSETGRQVGG